MLAELFYWVLNMSIIGSVAGLLVLSLRKLKILPRFAVYVLWLLPLIRFWLPFGIANQYSLRSLVQSPILDIPKVLFCRYGAGL
ncbi:MAG: hypothetical protein NHB14_04960 [Desulfosporosinus sp.]|nr:hypothetical protein [Desulfosporosinus sp.]